MYYSITGQAADIGRLYAGDPAPGDREATIEEVAAYEAAKVPSLAEAALAQIRALEQAHADIQARVTRIALLDLAVEKAGILLRAQVTASVTAAVNAIPDLTEQQRADTLAAQLAIQLAPITDAFVHSQLMLLDKAYKATFLLEEQVEALREIIKNSA